jgi:hypothetical protein
MPSAARLEVRSKDKPRLRSWVRASGIQAGLAQRARIVLLAGDGHSNTEIAARVGVSRPTVIHWRDRYAEGGLAALEGRKRSGGAVGAGNSAHVTPPADTRGAVRRVGRVVVRGGRFYSCQGGLEHFR